MSRLAPLSTTVSDAIRLWLDGKAAEGRSEATITQYRAAAQRFERFLTDTWPDQDVVTLDDIEQDHLRKYAMYLRTATIVTTVGTRTGKPLRPESQASYMRAVVNLFHWCAEYGLLNGDNPAAGKRLIPKVPRDPKRSPNRDDVGRLLAAVERPEPEGKGQVNFVPAFASRGRSLLWLMFEAGLRVGEIANLDITDYDSARGSLHVRGSKGGHSRWVFIDAARTALDLWIIKPREQLLRRRAPKGEDRRYFDGLAQSPRRTYQRTEDGPLFVDKLGQRMTPHGIRIWLRHLCERAGTPVYRTHDLRRLYITQAAANGMPLPQIMQQVGHVNPKTTMAYIVADPELQRDAASKASPLAAYRNGSRR